MHSASHSFYLFSRLPAALEWARGLSSPGMVTVDTIYDTPPRLTNSLSTVAGMTALYWWLNWYDRTEHIPESLSDDQLIERLIDYHIATTGEGSD